MKTFTIVFHGNNEQQAARAVAEKFATEHYEISVDISNPAEMLELVDYFDQPFGNPTLYLMYLISKHTRTKATVALCGAGGDELFAGYPRYRAVVGDTLAALAASARSSRYARHRPRGEEAELVVGVISAPVIILAVDDFCLSPLRIGLSQLDGGCKQLCSTCANSVRYGTGRIRSTHELLFDGFVESIIANRPPPVSAEDG